MGPEADGAQGNTDEPKTDDTVVDEEGKKTEEPAGNEEEPKTEDKPAGEEEGGEEEPAGAPEKYEAFDAPEGVEITAETLGKFEEVAKELGLTQEQAQSMVGLASENLTNGIEAAQNRVMTAWDDTRKGWNDNLANDKEFGGDNIKETIGRAKRAISKFGSPELSKRMEDIGYGDDDELIKMFARADKATCEDAPGGGDGDDDSAGPASFDDLANIMYPK